VNSNGSREKKVGMSKSGEEAEVIDEKMARYLENRDFWLRVNKKEEEKAEKKRLKKLREAQDAEDRWTRYCAGHLSKLKELNREESDLEQKEKQFWGDQLKELWQKESMSGSDGRLFAYPDKIAVALAFTLPKGAYGDDPSTVEEITENGSGGNFPIHPYKVAVTLAGDHLATPAFTLSEGVGEDDPPISGSESSSESSSEAESGSESSSESRMISSEAEDQGVEKEKEELPRLIKIEDPPEVYVDSGPVGNPGWETAEQRIARKHRAGYRAFKQRKWEVNQGIYVEPKEPSPISPLAGLPEKGTEDWLYFRGMHWREEAKRLTETFKWWKKCSGPRWRAGEEMRLWKLERLEIPFISYPGVDEPCESIKDMPENQGAIQEMIRLNPVLKEPEWVVQVQDWLDPEGAAARKEERIRRWEEERRAIEEAQRQAFLQRQREVQAQTLVQNQQPVFGEQNLGQWVREIEADERLRMETPTERRTRERRQEIRDIRRSLGRDGRFREIVEDIRRSPNGPERQEVFRRFWANRYTQEYQNPLARE
jgi:hypothetical protein